MMGNDAYDVFASEQVITCRDDQVGLRAVIAIDSTTLGPGFGGTGFGGPGFGGPQMPPRRGPDDDVIPGEEV